MKTNGIMTVTVSLAYPRSSTWGNTVRATVRATVDNGFGRILRADETVGRASGAGYDKKSAAICDAFSKNPCLQTLALWRGFDSCPGIGATWKCDYGYSYAFSGAGISTVDVLMRANGFSSNTVYDNDGTLTGCVFSRTVPADFLKLF